MKKSIVSLIFLLGLSLNLWAVTPLDKASFIAKVTDYETNEGVWNYEGEIPCILDFYTTWCGPCKKLSPVLAQLEKEYGGKIIVYKIDAEKNKELSALFGVSAYPTMIFCPMKGNPQKSVGLLPKDVIKKAIDQVLLGLTEVAPVAPSAPQELNPEETSAE